MGERMSSGNDNGITVPIQNTQLLNDWIDLRFAGDLTGTDNTGTDKDTVRVHLGDSVLIKSKTSVVSASGLPSMTDGQLIIGRTNKDPVSAVPTSQDSSIRITPGSGTLD